VINSIFKILNFKEYALLCDEVATKYAIEKLVITDLRQDLQASDTLVFFFAGHGDMRVDELTDEEFVVEEKSYILDRSERSSFLIPYDATYNGTAAIPIQYHECIDLDSLLRWISKLPARQILVILNACKSGLALNSIMKKPGVIGFNEDLDGLVSRKIITSATHMQNATDKEEANGLTPFAWGLIEGMANGAADYNNDGEISWDELGLYLKQRMKNEPDYIPDYGTFHNDDNGNFVIPLNYEYNILNDNNELIKVIRGNPRDFYQNYLNFLQGRGDISKARLNINRLKDMKLKEGFIPLSRHDLHMLSWQLESWEMLLSLPNQEFPPVKLFQQIDNNMNLVPYQGAYRIA
jgi:hypothetical protein